MSAWVFLLLGGMDSIVFGPIRWCVWSFRPSSPLRLPHLKFLFVCLFVANPPSVVWLRDCDQEPCVCGLGLLPDIRFVTGLFGLTGYLAPGRSIFGSV